MKFTPSKVTVLTKTRARKLATDAVADLTEAQARELESALRIRISSVKHLNRRMCLRVIDYIRNQEL